MGLSWAVHVDHYTILVVSQVDICAGHREIHHLCKLEFPLSRLKNGLKCSVTGFLILKGDLQTAHCKSAGSQLWSSPPVPWAPSG